MAYAKIENSIIVFKTYEVDKTLTEIPDNVCCGMIQNEDGTFSNPPVNTEEPMFRLREKRNQLLSATDWWCVSDRAPTPEQLQYRQALRDLPANSTPALDADGNLTGVEWPVKPA